MEISSLQGSSGMKMEQMVEFAPERLLTLLGGIVK
jgi:hypothetical protein